MTAPKFQPPDPPELPPADVPSNLKKGTGTRSIGDRLRFWRALAGLLLAFWAVAAAAFTWWLFTTQGLEGGYAAGFRWGLLIIGLYGLLTVGAILSDPTPKGG